MLKLLKVFPVEIGKEGFPFKKQQESQMKVFVQKLRIRFNLLLCRWCSKSLWIRFLLQIHQNFQVFVWKWGFDEISNDIFQCIQQVGRFSFRNKDIVAKVFGGWYHQQMGVATVDRYVAKTLMLRKKSEWWYEAKFFGENMLPKLKKKATFDY